MKQANCLDYLDWRGDLTFLQAPFCEVDNLILSVCSYLDFSGIVPTAQEGGSLSFLEAANRLRTRRGWDKIGAVLPEEIPHLMQRAAYCPRFGALRLCAYEDVLDERREMQFSALTFLLPDGTLFLAFRGTDDTLVGWKENFQMSFTSAVPSQLRAQAYLEAVARTHSGGLRAGGHSKGGNLAVWAAVHAPAEIRRRILTVYNNDGPGFSPDFLNSAPYQELSNRIITLIPQSSVVGMLFYHDGHYRTVESRQAAILQHDPFSWQVLGPAFRRLKQRSGIGRRSATAFQEWIASMNLQEREEFTDVFFGVLSSTNAKTLTELSDSWIDNTFAMLRAYRNLDKGTRKEMQGYLRRLLASIGRNGRPALPHLSKKTYRSRKGLRFLPPGH